MPPALSPEDFDALRRHALVVDARSMEDFARAHVPGSLSDVAQRAIEDGAVPVEVREQSELGEGLLTGAVHIPLGEVTARAAELPSEAPLVVYCGHGERSSSAISLLENAGVGPLPNLNGGIGAWRKAGCPVERPGSHGSTVDS